MKYFSKKFGFTLALLAVFSMAPMWPMHTRTTCLIKPIITNAAYAKPKVFQSSLPSQKSLRGQPSFPLHYLKHKTINCF
jgi:hypothetical protein